MKNKLLRLSGLMVGGLGAVALPIAALAQIKTGTNPVTCTGVNAVSISGLICKFNDILSILLPFLIALGVVYFVWGVVQYVIASDEEAKKTGRNRMIYGVIGLAVIVGLWGLVKIVTNSFDLQNNSQTITLPTVQYSNQ